MVDVTNDGGIDLYGGTGSSPNPEPGPGGPGGLGQNSGKIVNAGNGSDTTNETTIGGGGGGDGGEGIGAGGGAGNNGGYGWAQTKPNPAVASTGMVTSRALGTGGAGGVGGADYIGGQFVVLPSGMGAGGNGGYGYGSSYANNASGIAYSYGGAIGGGGGYGSTGGSGAVGKLGTVSASGTSARAVGVQVGGSGGAAMANGAAGGAGADSYIKNKVTGEVTAASPNSYLSLYQEAKAGGGGEAVGAGAQAGAAGNASSYLKFDDTLNAARARWLYAATVARGGAGGGGRQYFGDGIVGGYATGTNGGTASATDIVTGAYNIGKGNVFAGTGPFEPAFQTYSARAYGGSAQGLTAAAGGSAQAYAYAKGTGAGAYNVSTGARAEGGTGIGDGAGGDVLSAASKALDRNGTGGEFGTSGTALAQTEEYGGTGGTGTKNSPNGGNGGTVGNASAYAYGYNADATVTQIGGWGGRGYALGGTGGTGAQSILDDAVSGKTTGGFLDLAQSAMGGKGGGGYGGDANGAGGYAKSTLRYSDINDTKQPSATNGWVYATGGGAGAIGGGGGAAPAAGGNADANIALFGTNAVKATARATGGYGITTNDALTNPSNGGAGGNAQVQAYAYSAKGNATAVGVANGAFDGDIGEGAGKGFGTKRTGGTAGSATIASYAVAAYAAGAGASAYGLASVNGGSGGYGAGGADGAAGANEKINEALYGRSNGGTLALRQTALGGVGGGAGAGGGISGAGGYAYSYLNINDTVALSDDGSKLYGEVLESAILANSVAATGGAGGTGYGGVSGSTGGKAIAALTEAGANQVGGFGFPEGGYADGQGARADGGAGGLATAASGTPSGAGGLGGSAYAYDKATTYTAGSSNVSAYARTFGGLGGSATDGNGGNGGASNGAIAIANGATQTKGATNYTGIAYARAYSTGGAGGAGSGAGNVSGNGGAVSNSDRGFTSASATGYIAKAYATQTGGSGGNGISGASGGAGAGSNLNNAVTASAADYIKLRQVAQGGAGGASDGTGSTAGAAGYGYSSLNFANDTLGSQAKKVTAIVGGYGGNGGGQELSGGGTSAGAYGGASLTLNALGTASGTANARGGEGPEGATGGNAVANATVNSLGDDASDTASATATAYAGTSNGTDGNATANASAASALGQQATATATAFNAAAGTVSTNATTEAVNALVLGLTANTSSAAPLANTNYGEADSEIMVSAVNFGAASTGSAGGSAYSIATAAPTSAVTADILNPPILSGQPLPDPVIERALGSPNLIASDPVGGNSDAVIDGLGTLGVATPEFSGSGSFTATQTYYVTAAGLAGNLDLGLVYGDTLFGFTSGTLTVSVGGVNVLTTDFTPSAISGGGSTSSYFTDDVLNLGSFSGDTIPSGGLAVTISLNVNTTAGSTSGFSTEFVLGATGVVSLPVISAPATAVLGVNQLGLVPGASITEAGTTTGDIFTVTLKDTSGKLAIATSAETTAQGDDAAFKITGELSTDMVLTGSLEAVNAALAGLADSDATAGSDTINIAATDTNGGTAIDANIAVTVNAPPAIVTPVNRVSIGVDEPSTVMGYNADYSAIIPISLSEAGTVSPSELFQVTVTDSNGELSDSNGTVTYATANPSGDDEPLSFYGSLSDVNAALADLEATNTAPGTITVSAMDQFGNYATPESFSFTVYDTPAELAALTPTQIAALGTAGVTILPVAGAGVITPAQADAFIAAGITVFSTLGTTLSLTTSEVSGYLSPSIIAALPGIGVSAIYANNGDLDLTVAQAEQLETMRAASEYLSLSSANGPVILTDTAANIEAMTDAQLSGLPTLGFSGIAANDAAPVTLSLRLDQFEALPQFGFSITSGAAFLNLSDSAANIEAMQASDYYHLYEYGVDQIHATSGPLNFTIAQVLDLNQYLPNTYVFDDAAYAITVQDTAANIAALFAEGPGAISQLYQVMQNQLFGVTTLASPNGPLVLTVQEAENLAVAENSYGVNLTLGMPAGDSLTISDTAANIEAMTPDQILAVKAAGITGLTATDGGLSLSVAQALAVADPLTLTVPPGDSVVIADTAADIADLTPAVVSALTALGITSFQVSDTSPITTPLTIEPGVTVSVAAAVASGDAVTFAGASDRTGGTLQLSDTTDMQGTIYGFTPLDQLDLTDVSYNADTVSFDSADNQLTVEDADSNIFTLQLDPSQVFLTAPNFTENPDAGTGTMLTYTQAPVTDYEDVLSGQTVDGVVVAAGGTVEATAGGTVNRAIVQNGGTLVADNGAIVTDSFIEAGSVLAAYDFDALSGAIAFGTLQGDASFGPPLGGTLDISGGNDLSATITAFAPGDVIDIAGIPYTQGAAATLSTSSTLLLGSPVNSTTLTINDGGYQFILPIDPNQVFPGETFAVTQDAQGSGTEIVLTSLLDTGTTIASAAYAEGVVVTAGGTLIVQGDATLIDSVVTSGGAVTLLAGATLTGGQIDGGGIVDDLAGASLGASISFGSNGGTLEIGGTLLPATTLYGFGGGDIIDLTNVAYDPAWNADVPSTGSPLIFTENGIGYGFNIDLNQVFFGTSLALTADGNGGTDVQLVQAPITYDTSLNPGQTAAGLTFEDAIFTDYGMLTNAVIDGASEMYVYSGAVLSYATIEGGSQAYAGSATITDSVIDGGIINLNAGGTLSDSVITDGTVNDGFGGSVENIVIGANGLLDITYNASASGGVTFSGTGGTLEIDNSTPPAITVYDLTQGDTIDLTALTYDPTGSATLVENNLLQIYADGTDTYLQLDPTQDFSGESFVLEQDSGSGSDVMVICYLPGTRILTSAGEVCVEDLAQGDMVVTRFGGLQPVKWIGRQSYAPRFLSRNRLPVRIAAGALAPRMPASALYVSPGHSMLYNGQLILAKNLVNGVTITQEAWEETVEYYALDFGRHDCVLANQTWSESFADGPGLRTQFHNVKEFYTQFPDYAEPEMLSLCAPRPEAGPELDAALSPLIAALDVKPGPLRSFIETIDNGRIQGWAWDEANPDLPVLVEIWAGRMLLGTALACHYRGDLAEAGLGRGHCMFSFPLSGLEQGPFTVRRAHDGALLFMAATVQAAA